MVMETDGALAERLARDLDGSFEELVRGHQDRLYTIAFRYLGDHRDAEEATQDALVRAYRALTGYDTRRIRSVELRPWLATIVLNLCRTRTARRRRGGTTPLSLDADAPRAALPEPVADPDAAPDRTSERREIRARLAAHVAALPSMYRAAVVLRHIDGLTYPELAAALGRPEGTVKAQVHRGLALLRSALTADERREIEEMTA
jgi:RNA polymerase sigma-70 factor, ECF subfamily